MFLKTLKPTKVPGKNLKQLRKQLISELNLGPRINSVHSLWGEITDLTFFKALNDELKVVALICKRVEHFMKCHKICLESTL